MIEILIKFVNEIWWQLLLVFVAWFGIFLFLKKNPKTLMKRIEQNSIKVNVDGENVYLKKSKSMGGWRVIYPPIKIETIPLTKDGDFDWKDDWKNVKYDKIKLFFGSKANAVFTILIMVIVILASLGVYEVVNSYNEIMSNPNVQMCLKNAGIITG